MASAVDGVDNVELDCSCAGSVPVMVNGQDLPDPTGLFVVDASRYGGGHTLTIPGVGVTQTDPEHPDAEQMVRRCLADTYELPGEQFRIRIDYQLQQGPLLDLGDD